MLVLSRFPDERVFLDFAGIKVEMCVVDVRGNKVRLGFVAPRCVKIWRDELEEFQGHPTASAGSKVTVE